MCEPVRVFAHLRESVGVFVCPNSYNTEYTLSKVAVQRRCILYYQQCQPELQVKERVQFVL